MRKLSKTGEFSHYLLARLVTEKLIVLYIMLIKRVQYQGKAGFVKLKFQSSISRNTGKCKLGGILLRQSQLLHNIIIMYITYITLFIN